MSTFSIDDYTNRFIPPNQVPKLPRFLAHVLGESQPRKVPFYYVWLEILIGSFCGIAIIEGVFRSHTAFTAHNAPMIIASFGASAILCFNASASPLAQPRNVLVGHTISTTIGVCVQKLFSLSAAGRNHYWAGGALSVGLSSVAMSLLNCVHPPGGASSLLPCVDDNIRQMSWWYIPAQLVSAVLMLAVACITGNVIRTYPQYWWSPAPCGQFWSRKSQSESVPSPVESSSKEPSPLFESVPGLTKIVIDSNSIQIPEGIELDQMEEEWLETLRSRLAKT